MKNNISALSRSIKERESLIKETEDEILLVILTKIYLITKGYRNAYIHFYQFSESLCSNPEEVSRLEKFIEILTDQNFIASKAWGTISITHNGIKKVENLLENAYSKYASQIRNSISDIEKAEILEIQKLRYTILKLAHELSDQKKEKTVNLFKIGDPLDINREKLQRIYFYLQDEGLIDFYSLGGGFVVTDKGKQLIDKKDPNRIL